MGQQCCRSDASRRFDFSITVPCDFNTSISVFFGASTVIITPDTFNLGPIEGLDNQCLAGAASDSSLNGRELASDNLSENKADLKKNFGFSGMSSCGMFTLLGIWVLGKSALPQR